MDLLTQKQAADHFGCTKQYINKLVKAGKLDLVDGKYIDLAAAALLIKKKNGHRLVGDQIPLPGLPELPPELQEISTDTDLDKLERIRTYEQAKKLIIENEMKLGNLIDKKTVLKTTFELARKTRDMILDIAPRVASLAVGLDQHEIEMLILDESKKSLALLEENVREK